MIIWVMSGSLTQKLTELRFKYRIVPVHLATRPRGFEPPTCGFSYIHLFPGGLDHLFTRVRFERI